MKKRAVKQKFSKKVWNYIIPLGIIFVLGYFLVGLVISLLFVGFAFVFICFHYNGIMVRGSFVNPRKSGINIIISSFVFLLFFIISFFLLDVNWIAGNESREILASLVGGMFFLSFLISLLLGSYLLAKSLFVRNTKD